MENKQRELDLSIHRTHLAEQRTSMANARTFSAWVRTGLALVLAGLGIVNFLGERNATHYYVLAIGIIFVLSGILVYILAFNNYKNNMQGLETGNLNLAKLTKSLLIITIAMVISAILILGLLIYLS